VGSFACRFTKTEVTALASRYSYRAGDRLDELVSSARERGYFTKPQFLDLCYWKTPRSQSRVDSNSDELIQEATRIALSTPHERLRIGVLTLLYGVSWPTASVVLHFAHRDPYPILDRRALWSLGYDKPPALYTFGFWKEYVEFCRAMAVDCRVSMRVLDRALWQFSKEKQPRQEPDEL